MLQRTGYPALLVQLLIFIDIPDIRSQPFSLLKEQRLPALKFALYRDERAVDSCSVKVGDYAGDMRQLFERHSHAAALVVYQQERDIVRAVIHRKGKYHRHDKLALAGACRTRDESVGTVGFLVEVKIEQVSP